MIKPSYQNVLCPGLAWGRSLFWCPTSSFIAAVPATSLNSTALLLTLSQRKRRGRSGGSGQDKAHSLRFLHAMETVHLGCELWMADLGASYVIGTQ